MKKIKQIYKKIDEDTDWMLDIIIIFIIFIWAMILTPINEMLWFFICFFLFSGIFVWWLYKTVLFLSKYSKEIATYLKKQEEVKKENKKRKEEIKNYIKEYKKEIEEFLEKREKQEKELKKLYKFNISYYREFFIAWQKEEIKEIKDKIQSLMFCLSIRNKQLRELERK